MDYSNNYNEWRVIVIGQSDIRPLLLTIANAISHHKLWEWVKNYKLDRGFNYNSCKNKNITKIKVYIKNINKIFNNISGSVFNYCMKQMYIISVNGFENWNNLQFKD
jgi:hypothetical protein